MAKTRARAEATAAQEQRFADLYQQHYRAVLAYFLRRTSTDADATDATAETFAIAWRRIDRLPELPLPWLYGIARRVLANQQRSERRRARLHQRLQETFVAADPVDAQRAALLIDALASLSKNDRELLLLAAWEGLAPREIAQVLNVPATVISVRLHRARNRLRARLGATHGMADTRKAGAAIAP
jgi:RNA polymerase sigma factor (sigma-70 family)